MKEKTKTLTREMLIEKMSRGMAFTSKLSFIENYAMFMGKTQLIEFKLKKILSIRFCFSKSKLEKMTLGGAISELEKLGVRKDFISILRSLNKRRINMAHEFFVDHSALVALDRRFGRLSWKPLRNALAEVEQASHVFDFLNQNKYLFKRQIKTY
jgi:hypothetical protein